MSCTSSFDINFEWVEEGLGLWRLAFSWDEFRNQKLSAAVFSVAKK